MGLKEQIEQAHRQLQREQEAQKQQEALKAAEKAAQLRRVTEAVNRETTKVAMPFFDTINRSVCVPILRDLAQLCELMEHLDGDLIAKPKTKISFLSGRERQWANVLYDDVEPESRLLDVKTIRFGYGYGATSINTASLQVCDCHVELGWGEYDVDIGPQGESNWVTRGNRIKVSFVRKSLRTGIAVEASNDRSKTLLSLSPENVNRETTERVIARLYAEFL